MITATLILIKEFFGIAPPLTTTSKINSLMFLNQKSSTLGSRIGSLVALSVLSSCLLVALVLATFQFQRTLTNKRSELQGVVSVLASAISRPLEARDQQQVLSMLTSIGRVPNLQSALVLDSSGKTFAVMGNAPMLESDVSHISDGVFMALTKATQVGATPVVKGGKSVGRLILVSDISSLRNDFILTVCFSLAAACAAAAIGLFLSRPLQRRIVNPMAELVAAMRKIRVNRDFKTIVQHSSDDETGELVEAFNAMITTVRSRDMALQKVAYTDPLTGLGNRHGLQQLLEHSISKSSTAAAYLLDIDGFREINDTLGHSIADALLMDTAARLHGEATGSGHVFRLGGDEFMIVASKIENNNEAQKDIARYIAALYQPVRILGHDIHVSASAGIALIPRDGVTSSEIMRRCDLALQDAKKSGIGRVSIFQMDMEERIQSRNELVAGLRNGLLRNEFKLHYQPQVDLASGSVQGFEALVRWSHPVRGNISPAVFVPVAEKAGLIPELGLRILRNSCVQAKAWFKAGEGPFQVSVNVSAAQLVQADFLRDVQEALSVSGLPPPLLCLELTESVFLGKGINNVRHLFNDLKKMGIELALDDFGTGYSSLSYLEGLPFDKVKIDRTFVNGVNASAKKQSLLASIIELSHGLGMKVVAEGAETAEDIATLTAMKADSVQGYYFAKPAAPEDALMNAAAINLRYAPSKRLLAATGV
jgi:diguanylate cyclase (GGDEF)-like protein